MEYFDFSGKLKTRLLIGIAIGVISMILTFVAGGELAAARFWSNFLHNAVFFTGISFAAMFAVAVWITSWSGWFVMSKRVFESMAQFIGIGAIMMLIIAIGNYVGYHHLYHWADAEAVARDKVLQGKSPFLNNNFYLIATVVFLGVLYYIAKRVHALSVEEDEHGGPGDFSFQYKIRKYAAGYLPLTGVASAILIWLWLMSVDAHWYSTLYAWYAASSWWVTMIAFGILLILYLKSRGGLPNVNLDVIHDMGKFLFGFSIFWTYLWFDQFMLIWYGNVGEETVYFHTRLNEYPILFWAILILNFPIPFLVLMSNTNKRKVGTMVFTAIAVIIGHWLDFFLMVKPGTRHTAMELMAEHGGAEAGHEAAAHASHFALGFNLPGFLEIGTFIGFLSLFLYVTFTVLAKARLEPVHDPYIEEAKHHHV